MSEKKAVEDVIMGCCGMATVLFADGSAVTAEQEDVGDLSKGAIVEDHGTVYTFNKRYLASK